MKMHNYLIQLFLIIAVLMPSSSLFAGITNSDYYKNNYSVVLNQYSIENGIWKLTKNEQVNYKLVVNHYTNNNDNKSKSYKMSSICQNMDKIEFRISPYPVKEQITVTPLKENIIIREMSIYDAFGRHICGITYNPINNGISANMNYLAKGKYFIIAIDEQKREYSLSFIKE